MKLLVSETGHFPSWAGKKGVACLLGQRTTAQAPQQAGQLVSLALLIEGRKKKETEQFEIGNYLNSWTGQRR